LPAVPPQNGAAYDDDEDDDAPPVTPRVGADVETLTPLPPDLTADVVAASTVTDDDSDDEAPRQPVTPGVRAVRALYDYVAVDDGELSFDVSSAIGRVAHITR
jgi:hypothetical protein